MDGRLVPSTGGPMTTLLDPIDGRTATDAHQPGTGGVTEPARLSFTWLGTQRSLTPAQRARAAEAFDAEGRSLSAGKKLLDVNHPASRAVTAVRGQIGSFWKATSLPYPEPGIRLIRQDRAEEFAGQMADFRVELDDAVAELDRRYGELRRAAEVRLGSLVDGADYPGTLVGLFAVARDFPSVEPPDYLLRLAPAPYEAERARVAARSEGAVERAERAFAEEFDRLVEHLAGRISGAGEGGRPGAFRDPAVGDLAEFIGRFTAPNVRSDELVERARRAVRGVGARDLSDSTGLRRRVATQLGQVRSALDGLLVERPRRRIPRQSTASWEA